MEKKGGRWGRIDAMLGGGEVGVRRVINWLLFLLACTPESPPVIRPPQPPACHDGGCCAREAVRTKEQGRDTRLLRGCPICQYYCLSV